MSATQAADADGLALLRQILAQSRVAAFLGGAGVSAQSGLPDFRSPTAAAAVEARFGYPPEVILSADFFREEPETFFAYYKSCLLMPAEPNPAHYALAELERRGKLNAVITQNIDGLHRRAGSRRVYALHGDINANRCLRCGKPFDADFIRQSPGVPRCPDCNGVVKPEVVLYGEALDDYVYRHAKAAVFSADTLIVGGTSLTVYPAAGLLEFFIGKRLIILNQTPTPFDAQAQLILRAPIADTLGALYP